LGSWALGLLGSRALGLFGTWAYLKKSALCLRFHDSRFNWWFFFPYVFHPDIEKTRILVVLVLALELLDAFFKQNIEISISSSFGKCLLNPDNVGIPRFKWILALISPQSKFKGPTK
jgi:hypothetical protein